VFTVTVSLSTFTLSGFNLSSFILPFFAPFPGVVSHGGGL
jgi:hypothetical protein